MTNTQTYTPETIVAAYAAADKKGKAALRTYRDRAKDAAIAALDLPTAQAWLAVELSTATPTRPETDHAAILAGRIVALRIAAEHLVTGSHRPETMPEVDMERVAELVEQLFEEPTDEVAAEAGRIASAKVSRATTRRSVAEHVRQRLAYLDTDEPVTVADLSNIEGTSVYDETATNLNGRIAAMWASMDAGDREESGFVAVTDSDGRQAFQVA